MAALSTLSREERLGLGLAAAAHIALFAALGLHDRSPPAPLPIPERMDVSLADEISLQSIAPDPSPAQQAAVAPVLSAELAPAPAPEPLPEPIVREEPRPVVQPPPPPPPRPRPSARATPTPRPSPRSTQAPRPKPSAAAARPRPAASPTSRTGGATRIGSDFLDGASAGERTDSRGTPAATFGPAQAASLAQAISRELKPHWSAPQGADAELLVTVVRFRLNRDGSLAGTPEIVRQSGENATNAAQKSRHAEQAIRAVRLAAPFDLPEGFYDHWKTVTSQFDRRL